MLAREKWQVMTIAALEDVFEERVRQVERYGHNDELEDGTGPEKRWLSPLTEESADTIEKDLREEYEAYEDQVGHPTWMHLIREEVSEAFCESDPDKLQEELLQVAALCVSWVETLRKRTEAKP